MKCNKSNVQSVKYAMKTSRINKALHQLQSRHKFPDIQSQLFFKFCKRHRNICVRPRNIWNIEQTTINSEHFLVIRFLVNFWEILIIRPIQLCWPLISICLQKPELLWQVRALLEFLYSTECRQQKVIQRITGKCGLNTARTKCYRMYVVIVCKVTPKSRVMEREMVPHNRLTKNLRQSR